MSCASAQSGCAPCGALGYDCVDDAGLEESVCVGFSAAVTVQRFDEYDRRSDRWPEPVVAKCADDCECSWRALGEAADASAVDDQHESAGLVELTIADATHDRVRTRLLTRGRLAKFGSEVGEVGIGRFEDITSFELGAHRDLE